MLKERPVTFPGPAGLLEGLLGNESGVPNGAVIALHPHTLYGGSMNNNVVAAIVRSGQRCGFMTLRFNFRGVGCSEGDYSEGTGEQDDVGAALDFLERSFDIGTSVLAGYSFGACVALGYCHRLGHGVDHLLLISPPPFLLPKSLSLEASVVRKILVGEKDEIAVPDEIKARVSATRVEELVEVIPGADHFFWGRQEDLENRLVKILNV
ncbi:MAG: alpha/beta fold hydrolase [Desulfobacterales bacterium]|nr:MAG: alpha/beta fold hydrolase [Desulfobacterales bacterium]